MGEISVRKAEAEDAKALLEIYEPYVLKTAITFEYDVPTKEEFEKRIEAVLRKYPYVVAERDGQIVGYAYAHPFVGRAAYDWSAETSIYVAMDEKKSGVGKALYAALEDYLKKMGILNLYACIGSPEKEDEYLTHNSEEFHEHMGYRFIGRFNKCGYKFGRFYDMVWMEKIIGDHSGQLMPIKSFSEIYRESRCLSSLAGKR